MTHTHTHTHNPLHEGSARCRYLYLQIQTNNKWQTCMSPAGFEPAISESERSQIHALESTATGIGHHIFHHCENIRPSLLDCFLYFLNPSVSLMFLPLCLFPILFIPLCRVSVYAHFVVPVFCLSFYLLLFLYSHSLHMNLQLTAHRWRCNDSCFIFQNPRVKFPAGRPVITAEVCIDFFSPSGQISQTVSRPFPFTSLPIHFSLIIL